MLAVLSKIKVWRFLSRSWTPGVLGKVSLWVPGNLADAFSSPGGGVTSLPKVGCIIKQLQQAAQECLRTGGEAGRSGTPCKSFKPPVYK